LYLDDNVMMMICNDLMSTQKLTRSQLSLAHGHQFSVSVTSLLEFHWCWGIP